MEPIGVSVCVFTYNYERYLAQALDSVLAQRCNFPIEIVIGDDLSTDITRNIAEQYHHRYPNLIRLAFNETNLGGTRNWIKTINACKGKYIALLDGDDYFVDAFKLQKQYDAMESNEEYVLCFHSVEEKYEDMPGKELVVIFDKAEYTLKDFLNNGWFIRTATTFFRNGIAPVDPPQWVYDFPYRYDTILHVFLCMHGKAINLKDVMSVWRKHSKGMSFSLFKNEIKNKQIEIDLANKLNEYTIGIHNDVVRSYVSNAYTAMFGVFLKSGVFIKHPLKFIECIKHINFIRLLLMFKNKFLWK